MATTLNMDASAAGRISAIPSLGSVVDVSHVPARGTLTGALPQAPRDRIPTSFAAFGCSCRRAADRQSGCLRQEQEAARSYSSYGHSLIDDAALARPVRQWMAWRS